MFKQDDLDPGPESKVTGDVPMNDVPVNDLTADPGPGLDEMINNSSGGDMPLNQFGTEAIMPDGGDTVMANSDFIADTAAAAAHAMGVHIDPFIFRLTIFVLAIFVGYYVVWSVTPALHTPLMSVTNAISSVIIVGALLAVAVEVPGSWFTFTGGAASKWFGFFAVILASVNIFGGFLVTQRMLAMYKKKS